MWYNVRKILQRGNFMMKRIKLFLLLVLTSIFCCACGSEANGIVEEENLSELVSIVDEYFYVDSIGQAKHALIVKNNSSKTVKISNNITAKDASDKTIGAGTGSIDGVASGVEACVVTEVYDVVGVTDFECSLTIEEDTRNVPVTQNILFEQSLVGEKVIVTCTNNNEEDVKNLEVVALFFREGKFVYYGINWIQEIKAGGTVAIEVHARESYTEKMTYDDVKIFLSEM